MEYYVMHDLCKDNPPNPNDRAYFPLDNDLKNHIYMAKRAIQLSRLDQENAMLKIEQWRKQAKVSCEELSAVITVQELQELHSIMIIPS